LSSLSYLRIAKYMASWQKKRRIVVVVFPVPDLPRMNKFSGEFRIAYWLELSFISTIGSICRTLLSLWLRSKRAKDIIEFSLFSHPVD